MTALGPVPDGKRWVDVTDRGADVFAFLATEDDLGRACLVRATHNRNILLGHADADSAGKLFDYLRALPAATAQRSKKVFDETLGEERVATLAIHDAPVRICPPHVRRGEYRPRPLAVWGILVREVKPPKNGRAVEWFLLSNRVVASAESAWEKSDWYGCRPMVEEYHKCQKTGCQIEDLQFETSGALQPMVALLSVVAVMLQSQRGWCPRMVGVMARLDETPVHGRRRRSGTPPPEKKRKQGASSWGNLRGYGHLSTHAR